MNKKPLSPMGALHPIMFCIGMYAVALFFSVFICSSVFYALNQQDEPLDKMVERSMQKAPVVANASTSVLATTLK